MGNDYDIIDIAVATNNKSIYLFHKNSKENDIQVAKSADGFSFSKSRKKLAVIDSKKEEIDLSKLSNIHITTNDNKTFFLSGFLPSKEKNFIFSSKDLAKFKKIIEFNSLKNVVIFPKPYKEKGYLLFWDDNNICTATIDEQTIHQKHDVIKPRDNYFDRYPIKLTSVLKTESGFLIIYHICIPKREGNHFIFGAALLAIHDPKKVLWKTSYPIWEQPNDWDSKKVSVLGAIVFKEKLLFYFSTNEKKVYVVSHPSFDELLHIEHLLNTPKLNKSPKNPIITPVLQHMWESSATFNTAAIHEQGKVHFLYRAVGSASTSVLGYAASNDGEVIDERLSEPAYNPREPFELPGGKPLKKYMSGGGYGGCEDPRLTKIDDKLYLTYVAFDGWNPPRVALSSIPVNDFLEKKWTWSKPKLISKPDVVDKNAVLFPEKIKGKYVVMHRIFPNILIDFVNDLHFDKTYLEGKYAIKPRQDFWDSRKIGAGAPPIKTSQGWLLIYHAVDDRDASQYKIGAMLLDLENPLKVLYWSKNPIITPDMWYDNIGYKSGVVYPCGAVVKDNNLIVYYGGADTVVCAAKQQLDIFLDQLIKSSKVWPDDTILPKHINLYDNRSKKS